MGSEQSVDEQRGFIAGFPERGVYVVATCDDTRRILGIQDIMAASATPALAHVGAISTFVALGAHRRGIGRRLCSVTFREARARGFRKLTATIRADNSAALAFYQSQGFAVVGTARAHAFVGDRFVDEVLTEKMLE